MPKLWKSLSGSLMLKINETGRMKRAVGSITYSSLFFRLQNALEKELVFITVADAKMGTRIYLSKENDQAY